MFNPHARQIAQFAQQTPEGLARVGQFVILTIQTPLARVPSSMRQVDKMGHSATELWGTKSEALAWIQRNAAKLHSQLLEDWYDTRVPEEEFCEGWLAMLARQWPGIGIAKAGFFLQLSFNRIGCLDTHNLERFNIPERAFRDAKKRTPVRLAQLCRQYVETCERFGGVEGLWDSWCEYVAGKFPAMYRSAEYVSELHCEAILG